MQNRTKGVFSISFFLVLCYTIYMIELKEVSKKYFNKFYTLYNANAQLNSNTLFVDEDYGAVCLFRLIAKIDNPTSGEIYLNNVNLKTLKDKELNLAYLPQKPILFENKSVYKNLFYPLKIRKYNKNTAKNMVQDAILQLNFKKMPQKVKNLNLSEKKLLSLMRAKLHSPKLIMLENFFEDLDIAYHATSFNLINELSKTSLVLACEKTDKNLKCFANFNKTKIENGSLKK